MRAMETVKPLSGTAAASAARRARAQVKGQAEFSGHCLRSIVETCHGPQGTHIGRMPVVELLAAMPGVGPRRAEDLAARAGIAPGRRLAGLGPVQVEMLARLIDERADRRRARGQ